MTNDLQVDVNLPPFELLDLLADGEVHSGQELANLLGISRTAVWKQFAKFESIGLDIQSKPGKGYCIVGGIELLSLKQIRAEVAAPVLEKMASIDILKIVDSTNAYLLRKSPTENIVICLAECQTAGRGRRGRIWISPFAKNIYLSLKMTLDGGLGALEGLSLAIGVVIAKALTIVGVSDIQLKWPNDILWHGRKLGGILIEVVGDPAGTCELIVGIGLNINNDKSMQTAIDQPWVSLAEIMEGFGAKPSRNHVVAAILNQIIPLLAHYEHHGFTHYRSEWERLNAHLNQHVSVHVGARVVNGIVQGVNGEGALILLTDSGEQIFHGGEVSVRGIADDSRI